MLGSLSEAHDAVQDAWIRASRADATVVDNPAGWLTTIVARVCLNRLRNRRRRPEESLEAHIPHAIHRAEGAAGGRGGGPARRCRRPRIDDRPRDAQPRRAARLRPP